MRRTHLHPAPLRVAHERRRRIEAHRLRVQERAEELGRVVAAQPRRLVGEQPERGGVRLREAEPGEADELVVDRVRRLLVDAVAERTRRRSGGGTPRSPPRCACGSSRGAAPPPRRREAGAAAIATSSTWSWKTTTPSVSRERLAQRLVLDRRLERRIVALRCRCSMYGWTAFPWIGPGPDERDLHGEVVEVLRPRLQQALHLRAALDLEDADGVGAPGSRRRRRGSSSGMRERSIVSPRSARDPVDASSTAESIPSPSRSIFRKPASRAGVLVPLADLPAGHRGRLHRDELDERARRDHHPARVLARCGAAARRSRCVSSRNASQRGPAVPAGNAVELLADARSRPSRR